MFFPIAPSSLCNFPDFKNDQIPGLGGFAEDLEVAALAGGPGNLVENSCPQGIEVGPPPDEIDDLLQDRQIAGILQLTLKVQQAVDYRNDLFPEKTFVAPGPVYY
jgi:hypothetical protein